MTKNPTKKRVISLINNSFTENFINFLRVYNDLPGKGVVKSRFAAQSQSALGRARAINNDLYSTSFSQKIKKAEGHIIKQYSRQLQATFPRFSNSRLQLLVESKAESSLQLQTTLVSPLDDIVKLAPKDGLKIEKKIAFTVLLSVEHIRNAILSKRSVTAVGQTENVTATRPTRFQSFSEFKKQIYECRKVRLLYGNLSKKDLNKSAVKAKGIYGAAGENLLLILETRLDVTLHRCGFFPTIKAAKQSVIHKRITINNGIVDAPGYQMRAGDVIKIISSTINDNLLERCIRHKHAEHTHIKQVLVPEDDQGCTTFKDKKYLDSNSVKDPATAKWINEAVNERSFQWQYASSVDMIRCLLHLQCNILLPLLAHRHLYFSNKPFFLAKTFIKNYYKDRLNLPAKQNSSLSCLQNQLFGYTKYFTKGQTQNCFWAQSLTESVRLALSCFSAQKVKKPAFQDSYWLDLCFKRISLACESLQKQLLILPEKKACNSVSLQSTLDNFSKATLCLHIGTTLDTVFKTLRSIVWIITNIETKAIRYRKNRVKRGSNKNDYQYNLIFHLFCYVLLVQKKLISLSDRAFHLESTSTLNLHSGNTNKMRLYQSHYKYNKHKKKSKPLHLEVSYATLCAIYLYAPQRVYLPAVINLDLLRKAFY